MVLAQCGHCGIWHKLQDNGGAGPRGSAVLCTHVTTGLIDEIVYVDGSTADEDTEAPARTDEGL